jgi:FKBP-type peptidyl-prolyl cis-trans isomerase
MVKHSFKTLIAAFMALTLFSCAEDKSDSNREIQERILNAYVNTADFKAKYPNAEFWESGIVMLEYTQGTGETLDTREAGYFEYTTQSLSGEYLLTTDEEIARTTGEFAHTNYYGPRLFEMGYNSTYIGLEEVFEGMKVGGKAKFILPPWLTTTKNNPDWGDNVNTIYEVELTDVITNILKWEEDSMKVYANIHYPGLDTLSSNFYFKKLNDIPKDTIENSKSVKVYYIGRLLDGWVFDTNIADTAKKYGIYSKENDYEPLDVVYNSDLDAMEKDNSLVTGFCMAVQEMGYGDKAFTMFGSKYGYDYQGKDPIGPYQPLTFWLHVLEKEN